MKDIDNIYTFNNLYDSCNKCSHGVKWKKTVQHYVLNQLEETYKLYSEINSNTYVERKHKKFKIYDPKEREVLAISFRDRIYQRLLNDLVIYPTMTRSLITYNCACQKHKGTDYARQSLKKFLRQYYEIYRDNKGYLIHIDVKKYYNNIRHNRSEALFKQKLQDEYFSKVHDILKVYDNDNAIGYNAGSQLVQILGLIYLDKLDHYIKETLKVKFYIRYMDDMILIVNSSPQTYIDKIAQQLNDVDLQINKDKTSYTHLYKGVTFLGFKFLLNDKGKVYQIATTQYLKKLRRKLKKKICKQSINEFTTSYTCYRTYLARADNLQKIKLLNELYYSLLKYKIIKEQ